ncbi:MAG: terpene cyclase/mutase family protein, partial [Planctomycetes bacterium]|nr:terpene cyclase/mutase family protein [Planctomycetota bacterium]
VDLIVKSQNAAGSWRYVPFATDSDMSITVCQVQALRAARNVGLRVPPSTIARAIRYIKDSAIHEGPEKGAFKYQARTLTRASFPLTAAGITALYGAGVYDDEDIDRGLGYLLRNQDDLGEHYRNHYFYYYGHYYAVQAVFTAGGQYWREYYPKVRRELLARQDEDGSWPNDTGPGRAFGTAVACIILQIPNQYLPIFQR